MPDAGLLFFVFSDGTQIILFQNAFERAIPNAIKFRSLAKSLHLRERAIYIGAVAPQPVGARNMIEALQVDFGCQTPVSLLLDIDSVDRQLGWSALHQAVRGHMMKYEHQGLLAYFK